jgi:putative PIN family toxin of toxin-antitoxin system
MATKVVIDTNVLLSALSSRSIFHQLIKWILDGSIEMYVTDEIMLEYEEILKAKYSLTTADNFLKALKELPNVYYVNVFYKWRLLKDVDDDKFVDCFIAANAHFIVSNDSDYKTLKTLVFPKVTVLTIEDFMNQMA